jgi:hypothetical protein
MTSAHLQGWVLTLNAYKYIIAYRPGSENGNADLLSHLSLPETPREIPLLGETVRLLENLQSLLSASNIETFTVRDPTLSTVMEMVLRDRVNIMLTRNFSHSITEQMNCHFRMVVCSARGNRVVVPSSFNSKLLQELHAGHPGILRIKEIVQGEVWWPGIDAAIEERVKLFRQCQLNQKAPAVAPLHPWEWPDQPWS